MVYPDFIENEEQLDDLMSEPGDRLVSMMEKLRGDILILGASGKMGVQLAMMAKKASHRSGTGKRITGVSRFTDPNAREKLERFGISTVKCDLLDQQELGRLPDVENIIFMAGRKFGTTGSEELTWAVNGITPAFVCERYRKSKIVAYSTGCVYPFVDISSGGSLESDPPGPVGEYAQTTLARERVFQYYAKKFSIPVCLFRLNYSIDLRYGVLFDICSRVFREEPVDVTTGAVNVIWQGDAVERSLLCLDHCGVPSRPLNVTGPETVSVRYLAETFAAILGKTVRLRGEESRFCALSNASRSFELFGYPKVSLNRMIRWTAHWVRHGMPSLGKPTHFDERKGEF
ncbi:MAG: NAD-dependent epimerase/dehydratase family protein [Spirochaetia bacterium]